MIRTLKDLGKTKDLVNWWYISEYQKLSEEFIREHKDLVNWWYISKYQKLCEEFIREHKDRVEWYYISIYQKLSEEFIREHKNRVNWWHISKYQKLSEEIIREHKDVVDWYYISAYQKLSEEFIREHKHCVDWETISKYQKLSEEFIREHKDVIQHELINDSWHYKDKEFKEKQIRSTNAYECYEGYFIAYKGVRSDRYSNFNFQHQYLDGQTYDDWADYSSNENSFGLSVWTYEKAKEYCEKCVLKVKVRYEDVARIVHDNNKVRASRITILEEVKQK